MSAELLPRRATLPEWMRESSALGRLSHSVVTPMLAQDALRVPSGCEATIVAFPASAFDRDDVFAEIVTDSDWTIFGGLSMLPSWARVLSIVDGCVHVAADEKLAIFGAGPYLSCLLSALGERGVFVSQEWDDDAAALVETLNNHPQVLGLRINGLVDSADAVETLTHFEHLEWLAVLVAPDYGTGDASRMLAQISTIEALRHLELAFTRAEDLILLEALTGLRSLGLSTDRGNRWRPQFPELRTLRVGAADWRATVALPDGCPKLERFLVDWSGGVDEMLTAIENSPRLRYLSVRLYAQEAEPFTTMTIDRLACLVRVRLLRFIGLPYLDVTGGLLRRFAALTSLDTLNLKAIGATVEDVDWLAKRLPSTKLQIERHARFGPYLYDVDRLRSRLDRAVEQHVDQLVWVP